MSSPPVRYSVIIPVFNSEGVVGDTISRTATFFERQGLDYEIILVNDGSRDASWDVVRERAASNSHVVAVNLLRNYGQHNAVFCGLHHSTGDYVITLDDDLQNPPEEIAHLIAKTREGHDVVFGRFRVKRHALYRRWGTLLVGAINRRIFNQPKDLVLTSFRIVRRDVVDRVCAYQTLYPYVPGLVLMFAANPANVCVEHHERPVGKTNYNIIRITQLVMRILFNYSSWPLRMVAAMGIVISAVAFLMGAVFFVRALFTTGRQPGWSSLVVLLAFFNGVTLLILGMLGEYLVRLLNQTSSHRSYTVKEVVRSDG